jgi:transposase
MERPRRSFTEEYKHRAVELVMSAAARLRQLPRNSVRATVLRRWVDKLRQKPTSAAWRSTTQAPPMSAYGGGA